MDHDQEDQQRPRDVNADASAEDDSAKSSGGLSGESKSGSADGTTSGGIGSGANPGTGGDVGNWDEGGSIADAAAATEGKEIAYPAGTGAVPGGDWSARQAGTGRASDQGQTDEDDSGGS